MRFLPVVASCLFLLALAGCGGEDESSSPGGTVTQPPAQTTDPPAQTATEEEHEDPLVVSLYFLRDGQVGHSRRLAGEKRAKVATAAMEQLLAGPSADDRAAGLTTAIPAGTRLEGLSIADGTAQVDLSREPSPAAEAQVVYTLTRFPSVRRVSIDGGAPVSRADFEEQTPPIFAELPAPGDSVTSPLQIAGTANTFEATFQVEIRDAADRVIGKRFVTATSGSGTRGTFQAKVPFRAAEHGPGKLLLYELSAEDGSRIHEVEIPIELIP